jgi:hypothetical protein
MQNYHPGLDIALIKDLRDKGDEAQLEAMLGGPYTVPGQSAIGAGPTHAGTEPNQMADMAQSSTHVSDGAQGATSVLSSDTHSSTGLTFNPAGHVVRQRDDTPHGAVTKASSLMDNGASDHDRQM